MKKLLIIAIALTMILSGCGNTNWADYFPDVTSDKTSGEIQADADYHYYRSMYLIHRNSRRH